jgi:ABC-type nickel/cobalt efflux system permease component RcnA
MSINRNRVTRRFNAARHIVMGLILIGLAFPLVYYHKFGTMELSNMTSYAVAGIMVVYGLFRIWRGTRELRERDVDDFIS